MTRRQLPERVTAPSSVRPAAASATSPAGWQVDALVAVGLVAAVLVVFAQTATFEFVSYDDPLYLTENPAVRDGLTADSVRWAFTTFHATNWHPLTWLSHLVDVELYGFAPAGHHLTNVALHAAGAVLLFLAFARMTGQRWPRALVAVLFAVHPLRAESVAWVAERKDVLSTFFAAAVLLAWAGYVARPTLRRYLLVAALFALGLLAKPMLVTLPCVLLLLDVWPLRRLPVAPLDGTRAGRLVAEKLPLVVMAAASSAVTVLAQRDALGSLVELPLAARLGNALVAWVAYVGTSIAPIGLAVFYPHPVGGRPLWQPALAGLLLLAVTATVLLQLRRRPYLAVGWLWFAGSLVPVIGLVQVGSQAMADRYSYLPQVGLWLLLAWGLAELVERRPALTRAVVAGSLAALVVLMVAAWRQTATWSSSVTLYQRALACTTANWVAHANLAEVLLAAGRAEEGAEHARAALAINPQSPVAAALVGDAALRLDRPAEAVTAYRAARDLGAGGAVAAYRLGTAYRALGDRRETVAAYHAALALDPGFVPARTNLGVELLFARQSDEAAAVLCDPTAAAAADPLLHFNCGLALASLERLAEAAPRLRRATELNPAHAPSWRALAVVLDRLGRAGEAREAIVRALELEPGNREAAAFLAGLERR